MDRTILNIFRPSTPGESSSSVFGLRHNANVLKVGQRGAQLASRAVSSSAQISSEYVTGAVTAAEKAQASLAKAGNAEGVTAAIKTGAAARSVATSGAYGAWAAAKPFSLAATLKGVSVGSASPSLVGRAAYGFNTFARQLQALAAIFFMTITGYKIYENAKWACLSQDEFYEKIKPPTVEKVAKKHSDKAALKELVYGYFEDKIKDFLKSQPKGFEYIEYKSGGCKTEVCSENVKRYIDEHLSEMLANEDAGFITDQATWQECLLKANNDTVEAFGLYIRVRLAQQSHRQEIKRVFGKEGAKTIQKMQRGSTQDPALYKQVLSICRQRLILDTLNFVLGTAVLSLVAFTTLSALALPLLMKISKGSANFEYACFALKALVLGSIIFSPHGLVALTIFNIGLAIYSMAKGGTSKLPFMNPEEMKNYTRWDKLLIQFNIVLGLLSMASIGYVGSYTGVPLATTAAFASVQLPWLGFNAYGISQIWSTEKVRKEEEKQKLDELSAKIVDRYDLEKIKAQLEEIRQKAEADRSDLDRGYMEMLANGNRTGALSWMFRFCLLELRSEYGPELFSKVFARQEVIGHMNQQAQDAYSKSRASITNGRSIKQFLKEVDQAEKEKEARDLKAAYRSHYCSLTEKGLIKERWRGLFEF